MSSEIKPKYHPWTVTATMVILSIISLILTEYDFDTKDTYSIQIRSTDKGGLFVDRFFAINITEYKVLDFNMLLPLFSN